MPNPVVAVVASAAASTAVQDSASRRAAKAQERSAEQAVSGQREAQRSFERRTQPFEQFGLSAASPLAQLIGISPDQQQLVQSRQNIDALNAELASIDSQIAQAPSVPQTSGGRVFGGALGRVVAQISPQLEQRRQEIVTEISEAQALQDQIPAQNQQTSQPLSDPQTLAQVNPLVDFLRDEGFEEIQESAAARGRLGSGGTLKDLTRFNTQLASTVVPQLQQQRFNQLFNVLGLGANAATGSGTAGLQTAGNIGNLLQVGGAARAGGILGQGQALQQGIGNISGIVGAQQEGLFNQPSGGFNFLNNPNTGGAVVNPNRFGGVA